MNQIIRLFLCLIILLEVTGCIQKKIYHDQIGYAEDNKIQYEYSKNKCVQASFHEFPPQNFYIPPEYQPRQYSGGASFGLAFYEARMRYAADEARNQALQQMSDYNQARRIFYDMCMKNEGWYEIEVDVPIFD